MRKALSQWEDDSSYYFLCKYYITLFMIRFWSKVEKYTQNQMCMSGETNYWRQDLV